MPDIVIALTPRLDSSAVSLNSEYVDKAPNSVKLEVVKTAPTDLQLPAKRGKSSLGRWLHHIAFSYYRKIFTIIFTANLIAFIVILIQKDGDPVAPAIASATSANLMVALLFRQENFVNLCYEIALVCPRSAPLWLRTRLAKVFHYGGAHSGAGVAAAVWHIMYTVVLTRDYAATPSKWALATLITSYILVLLLCFILAAAHPSLRRRYHDYFEAVHRFTGWLALATFWSHIILVAHQYRALQASPPAFGRYITSTPSFWTLCISTLCLILSWIRLRRRAVYPEVLSSHAIRLHFKYSNNMAPVYGLKVSTRPLMEWHSFAIIPGNCSEPKGFSVLVSNAGDWTRECISNPPTKLWVRGAPLHGLLYSAKLFKKIVVVATGSGIGPCLSLLYADAPPRRIFWSTPNPLVTYGEKIVEEVKKADSEAWIWDTRTEGRPDMVSVTYKLMTESQAEAVFIISNPKVTRLVVYGMESRGIPAYGAIFDS